MQRDDKRGGSATALLRGDGNAGLTPGVIAALLVAQAFWGTGSVVCRAWISEGDGVGYTAYIMYKFAVAGVTLSIIARVVEGEGLSWPRLIGYGEAAALAALMVICSLTFLLAVGSIGSFLPAVGETMVPVYVCAVCVACQLEPVRRGKVAGVTCAVLGAVLVVAHEEARREMDGAFIELDARPPLGMFVVRHVSELWLRRPSALSLGLVMCAVHIIGAGNFWLLKKKMLYRAAPLHLSAWACLLASALAFVAVLCFGSPFAYATWRLSRKNLYALSFTILEAMCATGLTAWATKRTKATLVCASMTLQPLFSAFVSWASLQTSLHSDHIIGMVLTSCGLLLVVWSQGSEEDEGMYHVVDETVESTSKRMTSEIAYGGVSMLEAQRVV